MAKRRVIQGQLLRHHDGSVARYPGDVFSDAESAVAQQADIDRVSVIVPGATLISTSPVADDATSDTVPNYIGPLQ